MPLGRKIDDVLWIGQTLGRHDKHLARLHFTVAAGFRVGAEVFRIGFLKLQRYAFAHDTNAVDSIDQGFRVSLEQIAFCALDHLSSPHLAVQSSSNHKFTFDPKFFAIH